jgi:pimeloyl-ACP methyl ester carboxylesterase
LALFLVDFPAVSGVYNQIRSLTKSVVSVKKSKQFGKCLGPGRGLHRSVSFEPVWSILAVTSNLKIPPAAVLAGLALTACAPSVERLIDRHGLDRTVMTGSGYDHLVLRGTRGGGDRLHVYIEGDGLPWLHGRVPSADPTPRRPLALELMTLDHTPAAYVGRPCYFGTGPAVACRPDAWTFGRYGPDIVASMVAVIESAGRAAGDPELVIIGYSGGGVLARLVAAKLPQVVAVVTVAANLDTAAWTAQHGYLPLATSLNPADEPPLPANVRHIQLVGEHDTVVPPAVTERYRAAGQPLEVWNYDVDHRCCWRARWPAILERIDAELMTASRPDGHDET